MPQLRRAAAADAAAIGDLTRRAYARWVPALGREPPPMGADYAKVLREDRVDLAEEGETLLALVHTVLRPDDLLVENLAVAPEAQGRGLGARLLVLAEALAREAGRIRVRLYTNTLMGTNVAFYEKHGYRREREEPFGHGTRVHLVKGLASPAASV